MRSTSHCSLIRSLQEHFSGQFTAEEGEGEGERGGRGRGERGGRGRGERGGGGGYLLDTGVANLIICD